MCLTSSFYPIKARPAKCLEIQLHPKKRWSSGARLKLRVKTAQKVAIPRFMYCLNIFFEKKIQLSNIIVHLNDTHWKIVQRWGSEAYTLKIYYLNLICLIIPRGGAGESPTPPGISTCTKTLHIDIIFFQFWIRFYEKLKEKFPKEDGLNSKQTKFLLKTLLEVCDDGMCLSKITQENQLQPF